MYIRVVSDAGFSHLEMFPAYKTQRIILYHLPSLMVMFLSSSFLKRTVWTPEIAFTTVDLPWATCPIVPDEKDEKV
jgi:hypothetical protein